MNNNIKIKAFKLFLKRLAKLKNGEILDIVANPPTPNIQINERI